MPTNISDSVVVITGASSGIGRAAALAFADRGASVVVAGRHEPSLQEVVEQGTKLGARMLAVPTDVSDEAQVQELARRAVESFGRIDTWVNNAAVTLFARFEESPPEVFRQVVETNFFGTVYGARAAVRTFRRQGQGVLINVSSVVAIGQPYASAYVASKSAILGLTESIRMELSLDGAHDIHACAVLPGSTDTPLFQHAANYSGREVKPMPPIAPASDVANVIVDLAQHPKRQVTVGLAPKMLVLQDAIAPGLVERAFSRIVDRTHLGPRPVAPTAGNVFEPMEQWASVSGDWIPPEQPRPVGRVAASAAGVVASAVAWRRLGDDNRNGGNLARLRRAPRDVARNLRRLRR